jgi:hypothetical protein
MAREIPVTTFSGHLKQLDTDFKHPKMKMFFDLCFSSFEGLDGMYAKLKAHGWGGAGPVLGIVTAAGVEHNFGFRPRRFSGGPGLRPNSYFTLCKDETLNDGGTLRDELVAYYRGESGVVVDIMDPLIETATRQLLKEQWKWTDSDLEGNFYIFHYHVCRMTAEIKSKFGSEPIESFGSSFGVRGAKAEIGGVVDLRNPDTQTWFTETFLGRKSNFGDVIPAIISLQTGGGLVFTQAIGQALRKSGVSGVIFPSARSNSFNKVRNGKLVDFGGWNFVSYIGAEKVHQEDEVQLHPPSSDRDHNHIRVKYTKDGANRGSFSVRGPREYNLLSFDLEQRIAMGLYERGLIDRVGGSEQWEITEVANQILDADKKAGNLWYGDVSYFGLLSLLREEWPSRKVVSLNRFVEVGTRAMEGYEDTAE